MAIHVRKHSPQSNHGVLSDGAKIGSMWSRIGLYAGAAILLVLIIAYIDGGEEPLRPIVHATTLDTMAGEAL